MRYFTQYWTNRTWRREAGNNPKMNHTAGNSFGKNGVAPGDAIYIVTVRDGQLYLGGRIVVHKILSQSGAARFLKSKPDRLSEASQHIVSSARRPKSFTPSNKVKFSTAKNLRVLNASGSRGMKLSEDLKGLDPQTIRNVCELTRASAKALDACL